MEDALICDEDVREPTPFSAALRERSTSAHSSSEGAGFMSDLMRGEGTREDYIALVVQHWGRCWASLLRKQAMILQTRLRRFFLMQAMGQSFTVVR